MKIYLTSNAYLKLKYYALAADGEISGLGKCHALNEEAILVDDIYCLKQTSSGVHTELDKEAIAEFYEKMHKAKQDISQLRLWWHSHADMKSFFSGTDDETLKLGFKCDSYMVSVVINHDLEMVGKIELFKPFKYSLDATVGIYLEDKKLEARIKAEVEEKVTSPVAWYVGQKPHKKRKKKSKKKQGNLKDLERAIEDEDI